MSWFYTAIAGGVLWLTGSYGYSLQQQLQQPVENSSERSDEKEPFRGAWEDVSKQWGSDSFRKQRFVKVVEDTDVLGARIFLVDYGNGTRTVQYQDPRELL